MPLHPAFALRAPSREDAAAAEAALDELPDGIRRILDWVGIPVADPAEDDDAEAVGLGSPRDLLGLHRGAPVGQVAGRAAHAPDLVLLHRLPVLLAWAEGEDALGHAVRHVFIHEIGRRVGLSDADMEAVEAAAAREDAVRGGQASFDAPAARSAAPTASKSKSGIVGDGAGGTGRAGRVGRGRPCPVSAACRSGPQARSRAQARRRSSSPQAVRPTPDHGPRQAHRARLDPARPVRPGPPASPRDRGLGQAGPPARSGQQATPRHKRTATGSGGCRGAHGTQS